MRFETVLNWAEKERAEIFQNQDEEIQRASKQLMEEVRKVLGDKEEIQTAQEVFECCEILDNLPVDERLLKVFNSIRSMVLVRIFEMYEREKRRETKPGDTQRSQKIDQEKRLCLTVARLIELLKEKRPETFGPSWIQNNNRPLYEEMKRLLSSDTDGKTATNWQEITDFLPGTWAKKFLVEKKLSKDEILAEAIDEYKEIAEALGPEALAEFLISFPNASERDFSKLLRIIAQYLGRTETKAFDFKGFAEIPEVALKLEGFRKLVFIKLRNHIYREILKTTTEIGQTNKEKLEKIITIAKEILSPEKLVHQTLLAEVVGYFRKILAIKTPARLKNKVIDKQEGEHEFPSLRQRIAMEQMERNDGENRNGRRLICFPAGKGKTAGAFLAKEHVGAKKMLYLCPNEDLVDQTAKRVEKYYKKEALPTVGKIVAGMDKAAIEQALKQEIVIMPFSMFGAKRDEIAVIDLIKAEKFDFVTVDEAHNARKEEGAYTQAVYDIVTGIEGLYEKGHVMLLTANPTPNMPDDFVPQLRIFDKDTYSETGSLREVFRRQDPLKTRNVSLDFIVNPDKPEEWEQYIEYMPIDLSGEEASIYATIVDDEHRQLLKKLRDLRLVMLNPQYYDASFESKGTIARELADALLEDMEREDVILVGEPTCKEAVTRRGENQPDVPTFVENIEKLLAEKNQIVPYDSSLKNRETVKVMARYAKTQGKKLVITAIYDGDTSPTDREDILELSKEAPGLGIKFVLFGLTPTIREGRDLSHFNIAYLLAPEFNHPDLYQFLKRFRRELNEKAKVKVLTSSASILEGIYLHALQKYILCNRFLHGGTLVEAELELFNKDGTDTGPVMKDQKVVFGTAITDKLLSRKQKLAKMASYFHNRGVDEYERVMAFFGKEYAQMYSEDWEKSSSAATARLMSGIIMDLQKTKNLTGKSIADVACGPLTLVNTLGLNDTEMQIDSFDMSPQMLDEGEKLQKKLAGTGEYRAYTARMNAIERDNIPVPDNHYDCVTMGDALQLTNLNLKKKPATDERAQALIEQNRILKAGGVLILTLPFYSCTKEEFDSLSKELKNFGFRILEKYTGRASSDTGADKFQNYIIVCEKISDPDLGKVNMENLKLSARYLPVVGKTSYHKGSIHTDFKVEKTSVSFLSRNDESLLEAEQERKRRVGRAQTILGKIWLSKGQTFSKLTGAEKTLLAANQIKLFSPEGKNSWRFTVEKNTELHAFVP